MTLDRVRLSVILGTTLTPIWIAGPTQESWSGSVRTGELERVFGNCAGAAEIFEGEAWLDYARERRGDPKRQKPRE